MDVVTIDEGSSDHNPLLITLGNGQADKQKTRIITDWKKFRRLSRRDEPRRGPTNGEEQEEAVKALGEDIHDGDIPEAKAQAKEQSKKTGSRIPVEGKPEQSQVAAESSTKEKLGPGHRGARPTKNGFLEPTEGPQEQEDDHPTAADGKGGKLYTHEDMSSLFASSLEQQFKVDLQPEDDQDAESPGVDQIGNHALNQPSIG